MHFLSSSVHPCNKEKKIQKKTPKTQKTPKKTERKTPSENCTAMQNEHL